MIKNKKWLKRNVWATLYGRGSRTWTHGTRFWRPMLYQLSYTPVWWAFTGSNRGPAGYEPAALTNWAKGPTFDPIQTDY